jgi:DNA-binding NtrC family response regulator
MGPTKTLLFIANNPEVLVGVQDRLDASGFSVTVVASNRAVVPLLTSDAHDVILCELGHANGNGLHAGPHPLPLFPSALILAGHKTDTGSTPAATCTYLEAPVDPAALLAALDRTVRGGAIATSLPPSTSALRHPFPSLIGAAPAMQRVYEDITKVAAVDSNVCVYGESGTGKELVARAIHYASRRAHRPLVVFDCTAVPEGLMESEMFGHVKGSFTSALTSREGVFELTHGGSLFIDEIGELSLALQAKLLRVLQAREFRKVGGKDLIQVDVRILAATNKNLRTLVAEGRFRADLLYRLEVIPMCLPPLRERKADIPLLVTHFLTRFNRTNVKQIEGVTPATLTALLQYAWPGNVRELENCIERAAAMADRTAIDVKDIAFLLDTPGPAPVLGKLKQSRSLAEQELIARTLQLVHGNRVQAAKLLGISVRTLHYKLNRLTGRQMPGAVADCPADGRKRWTSDSMDRE